MTDQKRHEPEASRGACRQFETNLADYLEGEPCPQVAAHADTCPFCSVILRDLEGMRTECRTLSLEDPPARLWANVRATLATEGVIRERRQGFLGGLAFPVFGRAAVPVTALACLAVLSSVLMVRPSSINRSRTSSWLSVADRDATAAKVYTLDNSALAGMVGELENNFEARRGSLAPSVQESYRKGLQSLDDSIRECRQSVESEPGNTLAREYLVAAYSQKAEVLAAALKYDVP